MTRVRQSGSLTVSAEDYLKTIYLLAAPDGRATNLAIAKCLRVSRASVTVMLQRLAERKLVVYERYAAPKLTDEGRRAAERVLRRGHVLESYLARVLHYPDDLISAEVERLEHAASELLIDHLAQALVE